MVGGLKASAVEAAGVFALIELVGVNRPGEAGGGGGGVCGELGVVVAVAPNFRRTPLKPVEGAGEDYCGEEDEERFGAKQMRW